MCGAAGPEREAPGARYRQRCHSPLRHWGAMTETAPRRARAEIDLAALRANVRTLRAHAPGAALMAVVKSDAYGHGAVPCARAAVAAGATWLGTATPEEALALRARAGLPDGDRCQSCLCMPRGPWTEELD